MSNALNGPEADRVHDKQEEFLKKKHIKYLTRVLQVLPESASSYDTTRMTIAFFGIAGLHVLQAGMSGNLEERERAIKWIKHNYVHDKESDTAGFHGGSFVTGKATGHLHPQSHPGHVSMTYTALACLRILDDDLSDLDIPALARGVAALQNPDGSVNSSLEGGESDMRFVFCATAVCTLINDWTDFNKDAAANFILQSINFDGGFGQGPGLEGHGGSTFCAIASLKLMDRLCDLTDLQRSRLLRWCLNRLTGKGFNGRPNKEGDTCYSFWVGATLKILDPFPEIDNIIARKEHMAKA